MSSSLFSRFSLLVLCSLLSVSVPLVFSQSSASPHYIVMIDAGSTGSRAHVHQYINNPGRALPDVHPSVNKKITPGLSSYAKRPTDAVKPVSELIEFIKQTVPMSKWQETPVYLQATAGLRSVTPQEAEAILQTVRDTLQASPFKFDRSWARIISGIDEGVNGWLAANYLLGSFDAPQTVVSTDGIAATAQPKTVGVVEMGGSSTQLTFAPSQPDAGEADHLVEVTVAGHKYQLYTYSYLSFGLQAAEKLFQTKAMDMIEEKGNPCYPKAFRHSSTGSFSDCLNAVTQLVLDKTPPCPHARCSFLGVYQPQILHEPFVAIENFYYTGEFFGLASDSVDSKAPWPTGNQLVEQLKQKGNEYCSQEWNAINTQFNKVKPHELAIYCFATAYEAAILEAGFGFTARSNLRPARLINRNPIDWELGAVIQELSGNHAKSTLVAGGAFSSSFAAQGACQGCYLMVAIVIVGAIALCAGVTRMQKKASYNMYKI